MTEIPGGAYTVHLTYSDTNVARDQILERGLMIWRAFTGDESETFPWSTSMIVESDGELLTADLTIRWDRRH